MATGAKRKSGKSGKSRKHPPGSRTRKAGYKGPSVWEKYRKDDPVVKSRLAVRQSFEEKPMAIAAAPVAENKMRVGSADVPEEALP